MDTEQGAIPLTILGGRDRGSTELPEAGRDKHVLRGYKAVDLRIGDRPLINILLERLRACKLFDPIFIAGPRAVYEPVVSGVPLIDTDSAFGENIRASVETVKKKVRSRLLAFISCDILPDPDELRRALEDFQRHRSRDFWTLTIRAPEDPGKLGESAWKPKYMIQPEGEEEPVPIMPGHLTIVDPEALRLDLLYRVFEIVYRTRNRPLAYRRAVMTRTFLFNLVAEDLRRIFSFRWPSYTGTMVINGLTIAAKLMADSLTQTDLEVRLSRMFTKSKHRRRHPERRGRVAILDGLSLAKDIDTEEEAREAARALEPAR